MKKVIITEGLYRSLLRENFNLKEVDQLKTMFDSVDVENINLAIILIEARMELVDFIRINFSTRQSLPEGFFEVLSEETKLALLEVGFPLSYTQFRKYKSDERVMSVYITKKIPEDQVDDLRGTKYLEPYMKNRVQAEIRDFKEYGFDSNAFSGTELTLLSRGQMMLLGGLGFLFDDFTLQFLLKKSPSQLEGYIRGIFEFVKKGGELKYHDILKYMTDSEWEEYISIKGGQLTSEKEMKMLWQAAKDDGSSILKDYITRRANEAINSDEEVEDFESDYLDYLDEELLKKYYEFFGYDYP
jgi:hypothetical protein